MFPPTPIIALCLIFCLAGCAPAPKSIVWKARDVDISSRTIFDIQPVLDTSERSAGPDILIMLHENLKRQFELHNLRLIESGPADGETLLVTVEILGLRIRHIKKLAPYTDYRTTQLILRSRFLVKASGKTAAEFITFNEMDVGKGLFTPNDPLAILMKAAETVAGEVVKLK